MENSNHQPVLLNEVIALLNLNNGKNIIDATCGLGGHTKEIIKFILPKGKVLAIDWDREILNKAKENLKDFSRNIIFRQENYANIKSILKESQLKNLKWQGILFDFGFCLNQIKNSGRGFTFLKDEVLDMRYDLKSSLTAAKILNQYYKEDLARIFLHYGQERKSRQIAQMIVNYRKNKKIERTTQLNEIIFKIIPKSNRARLHPATKIYQALRIEVNNELENIKKGLNDGFDILEKEAILIAISYHSLEDKIVKNFLKEKQKNQQAIILTKKPITPKKEEIILNPRSRSAKLRALKKL
jgi:16S rRNA (cytosine1402-N4)-methyltransferase